MRATFGLVISIPYGVSSLPAMASSRFSRIAVRDPPPLLIVFPVSLSTSVPRIPANREPGADNSAREWQPCGTDVASRPLTCPRPAPTGYLVRKRRRTGSGAQAAAADPAQESAGLYTRGASRAARLRAHHRHPLGTRRDRTPGVAAPPAHPGAAAHRRGTERAAGRCRGRAGPARRLHAGHVRPAGLLPVGRLHGARHGRFLRTRHRQPA